MFFKKGLRDPSLILKLTMKNPRLKEMSAIVNKYTLAVEATLDNREGKKDKEVSQSYRPNTSKNSDKKRKHDYSVTNIERLREFEGFLDGICIFHPQGKDKTQDCSRLQGFATEVIKSAKNAK
jgi:hypothetical protein